MAQNELYALCSFISRAHAEPLPAPVLEQAKLVLLDCLGVMVAGASQPQLEKVAGEFSCCSAAGRGATCPGRAGAYDPLVAGLLAGMAGSSLEFEEGCDAALGHPGVQVVPAAVIEAETRGASGRSLLTAIACGYEAAARLSRAAAMRRGLHPNGTWGCPASALGVGCCSGRSAAALCQIANIAASYAFSPSVKNSFAGKTVACTFAGQVNYIGLLSNRLYDAGIRADEGCLELTFSRILSESFTADALTDGLGSDFAILKNFFKPFPACRFTHPALEALRQILAQEKIMAEEVAALTVHSFKAAVHAGSPPDNAEALRFSLPYLLAAMLVHGRLDLGVIADDTVSDPRVRDLAGKTALELSPHYEQARPQQNSARVTLQLTSGRELSREVIHCPGDPANPLSEKDLQEKFLTLSSPVIGSKRAQACVDELQRLDAAASVRPLMALVQLPS